MNLEQLVRAALAEEAKTEPEEAGAYADARRITIHTAVTQPNEYPGKPATGPVNDRGGQSFSTLSGHRSSGRRADGRTFLSGDQGGVLGYMIAWPYRCDPGVPCPEAARWRVLQFEVEGTGRQAGLKVRAVVHRLVESIRPITNALPRAGGESVPEEPRLFADDPVVVGRGGQGDYAWEVRARKGSGQDFWIARPSTRTASSSWARCSPSWPARSRWPPSTARRRGAGGRSPGRPSSPATPAAAANLPKWSCRPGST